MDGHVQMRKCSQIQNACAHACTECRREMGGGGGHLMGAPTNRKDGLWGQWWAKLPWVLEWQGQTGGSKCNAIWLEVEGGTCGRAKRCRGEVGGGGGRPKREPAPPKEGPLERGWRGGTPVGGLNSGPHWSK